MPNPYEEIVKLLRKNGVSFEEILHEPVYTSEQAAAVRGLDMHAGAKSLLLKAGAKFVLVVLPGDKKLDSKKLREHLKVKELRFAKPEEVKEIMGCEIGACYPFGSIAGVKMLADPTLQENEIISFNPGVHNKSIKIKWQDYLGLLEPASLRDLSVN